MSSNDFFFSLVRITCAQIFRAAGIDRCAPSTLDTITDILIRHLDLLSTECIRLAQLSGRSEVIIQDLAFAMEKTGVIRPLALLDPADVDPNGIAGFEDFVAWAKGPVPQEARRISTIPQLQSGGAPTSNAAAAAAASSAANAQAAVNKGEVVPSSAQVTSLNDNDNEKDAEWLTSLMKKQVKVGHETKFKGTVLGDDNVVANDTQVAGGNGPKV